MYTGKLLEENTFQYYIWKFISKKIFSFEYNRFFFNPFLLISLHSIGFPPAIEEEKKRSSSEEEDHDDLKLPPALGHKSKSDPFTNRGGFALLESPT